MDFFTNVLDWIEKHPVSFGAIAAMSAFLFKLIHDRYSDRVRLKLLLTGSKVSLTRNQDGNVDLPSIGIRIQINNLSKSPVTISKFYLDCPKALRQIKKLRQMVPGPLDFNEGVRMYQNHLFLFDESGNRRKVPIDLNRVEYFEAELVDKEINGYLNGEAVRFVVIDQKGKHHRSNKYLLSPVEMIKNRGN